MLSCDDYLSPGTLDDAFDAMEAHAGRFRLVAGATDLLPWAREGRAGDVHIPVLIDVSGIEELRRRQVVDGRVQLGAATAYQRCLDDPVLVDSLPVMPRCAVWFADDQIRETATIGGNLINASPAADGTPALLAANADVELAHRRNGRIERRRLPLSAFVTGPSMTAIAADEILVKIHCDHLAGYGAAFEKVGHRRSLVISTVCLAAMVKLDGTGSRFGDVRLALAGTGPIPQRLHAVEAFLTAREISAEVLAEAAEMPVALVASRTRRDYRRDVVRGFVRRGLSTAAQRAGFDPKILSPQLEASHVRDHA